MFLVVLISMFNGKSLHTFRVGTVGQEVARPPYLFFLPIKEKQLIVTVDIVVRSYYATFPSFENALTVETQLLSAARLLARKERYSPFSVLSFARSG
jgi:hypothetical protein